MATTTGTELVKIDDAMLEILTGMVDKDDTTGASAPILKVNYVPTDEGCLFPRGCWVVGQTKDVDGNIVDQGKMVDSVVILAVRNRYSFYDRKNTTRNCSSPLHKTGDVVKGNKYGNVCGPACPYRDRTLITRCKCQRVIFGVAYTHEGEGIDSLCYVQGASFMGFIDYFKKLTKKQGTSGSRDVPPFCHPTILGTEKQKFDSTVYFVGTFTQGPMFDMDKIEAFRVRRDGARQLIDALNAAHAERREPVPAVAVEEESREVIVPTVVPPEVSPDADVPF